MSKLRDKAYKEYSYTSRYSPFPYYYNVEDNKYMYGLTTYLDDTTLYSLHVVRAGETLDNLALHYYNNPTLYWVICSFNHIQDPYIKLTEGQTLRIPALSNIMYDFEGRS